MNVYILTLGTRGDFELFLTLGRALARRGHGVTLATSPFHLDRVRVAGLAPAAIGDDNERKLASILRSLASEPDRRARTLAYYQNWLRPQLEPNLAAMAQSAGTHDYFISNLKLVLRRGQGVMPGAAATYDPPGSPAELDVYGARGHEGRILDLVAMPRDLVDHENTWPSDYHFNGFWVDPEAASRRPSPELESFVAAGTPPVVATFGSMVMFDPARIAAKLDQALALAGRRGVLVGGWSEVAPGLLSERLFATAEAPYDWLFPRGSCVVHHGGCGTAAAALRAGRGSVVFPQILAQETFARLLAGRGLAATPVDLATASTAELAAAIRMADLLRPAAEAWARDHAADRGVEAAVDLIESHARLFVSGV
jgi:UDP:flavonoid glycosyltransferase YjiC (YdhE family)